MSSARFLLCTLLLLFTACGAPSHLDLCYASCDNTVRCSPVFLGGAFLPNCQNTCQQGTGAFAEQDQKDDIRCQNAGDVRKRVLDCIHNTCGLDVATCQTSAATFCILR